jgi:hypothetical protein
VHPLSGNNQADRASSAQWMGEAFELDLASQQASAPEMEASKDLEMFYKEDDRNERNRRSC